MRRHLFAAADLVPNNVRPQEAAALEEDSSRMTRSRKSGGLKHISEAIRLVVARLLGQQVQSDAEVQSSD